MTGSDCSPVQRVFLLPHDPRWSEEFHREATLISNALGEVLVQTHHIGSTAIPGICAKPIIDILAVVRDLATLDAATTKLVALGYEAMGEFGISGRRYFRKNSAAGDRTHQIHAFDPGSSQIERHIAFRDFLKAHPDHAERYGALKSELAERYPSDIGSYSNGKDALIHEIDALAAAWRKTNTGS